MMNIVSFNRPAHGRHGAVDDSGFLRAVINGLSQPQKSIPSRYFYDMRGSQLFEEITKLDEYYPTRAEVEILSQQGGAIGKAAQDMRVLVEFGAGSTRKVRLLLDAMPQLDIYAPIDISADFMSEEASTLADDYPDLQVVPVHADFMSDVRMPQAVTGQHRLVFFPGSTIGNLEPREALRLLERMANVAGSTGKALIGVDLKKDESVLLPAYDDAKGVTAAFNLNLLRRVNRELGANFDLDAFAHEARYDADLGRVEMHLVSRKKQDVKVAGKSFTFAEGESIHTENSYKYSPGEFHLLCRAAGFAPAATWFDQARQFCLHLLEPGKS